MPKAMRVPATLERSFTIERAAHIDEDARTVEVAFSSEEPVPEFFAIEILDHKKGSVRMGRLKSGSAPVLLQHRSDQHVGVVTEAKIGSDRVGRAVLRFGKGEQAELVFRDIVDGIRKNVSMAGVKHRAVLEKENDEGPDVIRITDWEPFEISIVAVPSDPTVGVGRAADGAGEIEVEPLAKETETMAEEITTPVADPGAAQVPAPIARAAEPVAPAPAPVAPTAAPAPAALATVPATVVRESTADAVTAERNRIAAITRYGEVHNQAELATKAVQDGTTIDAFLRQLIDAMPEAKGTASPASEIGLSDTETSSWSLFRAVRAMADKAPGEAGLEYEASQAIAKKLGRPPQGLFVPAEVQRRVMFLPPGFVSRGAEAFVRDLSTDVITAGGSLVATVQAAGSFIERLINRMMVRRMGARILTGLVGDVDIPSQTGGATAFWVGEAENVTESQLKTGQLKLRPKTVAGRTDLTRRLLMQSSPSAEDLVFDDLSVVMSLKIDLAAINGLGSDSQPLGIMKTTGIGDVAGGTNGLAPTWDHIVELETDVAVANADVGTLGYLTNANARGKLKTTPKVTAQAIYIWGDSLEPGIGMLNGYRAGVSNQVPNNLTKGSGSNLSAILFGNFGDIIIAEWGILDITAERVTLADQGGATVRAFQDVDVALRHAASFSAMQDAITI